MKGDREILTEALQMELGALVLLRGPSFFVSLDALAAAAKGSSGVSIAEAVPKSNRRTPGPQAET